MLEVKIFVPRLLFRLATPFIAMLLLSVAPDVKTIVLVSSALISLATSSLLLSSAFFASWPKLCRDEGLPNDEFIYSNISSITWGSTGFPDE